MKWIFPGVLFVLLFGCMENKIDQEQENFQENRQEIEGEWGSLVLIWYGEEYKYTDVIPLNLELQVKEGHLVYEDLPGEGKSRGGFEISRRTYNPDESVRWSLRPLEKGDQSWPALDITIQNGQEKRIITLPSIQFTIGSSLLEGSDKPAGLIQIEESESSRVILPVIIGILILLIGTVLLFMFLRKKKTPLEKGETCRQILENIRLYRSRSITEPQELKEIYRMIYEQVNLFLHKKNPDLRIGLDPESMMAELEKPSSLNQWALRTLYPLMERMIQLFYNPDWIEQEPEIFIQDVNTVITCLEFIEEEESTE